MFKRIISVVCVLALLLLLSACGGQKDEKLSSSKKTSASEKNSKPSEPDSSEPPVSKPKPLKQEHPEYWDNMVSLTFDDGPQDCNDELLDILKAKGVKATFFLQGNQMELRPDLVRRIVAEGHDLGWHSYEHNVSAQSNQNFVDNDFSKAQQILDDILEGSGLQYKITLMRNPGGNLSDAIKEGARKNDWRIINWTNYGIDDSATSTAAPAERIANIFEKKGLANGDVFLIHPRTSDVAKAVGLLIDDLQAKGYQCVAVSELLKRKNGGEAGEVYAHSTIIY